MMVHRTTPKAHQKRTSASLDEQGLGVSGSHSRCAVRHETFSPLYRDSASWRWEETLRRMLITPIRVGQPRRKRSYSHVRTERRDPATLPHSPFRRLVARHPVVSFLLMAVVFAWTIMLPLLLSKSGFGVLPFVLPWQVFGSLMYIFCLALPAFLVTAAQDGKEGVR